MTLRAAMLGRLAIVLPLALAGCVTDPQVQASSSMSLGPSPYFGGDLGSLTYRAVDILLASAPQVDGTTPLFVASIANIQKLETGSAFGNIVADMIRSRLAQTGHDATDMRLRSSVGLRNGTGEFMLSRDRRDLMPAPAASAIITGTYAASYEKVYVSLKLLSASDSRILAGADFVVSRQDLEGLLGGS
jgi:FlgO protein